MEGPDAHKGFLARRSTADSLSSSYSHLPPNRHPSDVPSMASDSSGQGTDIYLPSLTPPSSSGASGSNNPNLLNLLPSSSQPHKPQPYAATLSHPQRDGRLTLVSGAGGDPVSPGITSLNAGAPSGANAPNGVSQQNYTFGGHSQNAWPTPNSNYGGTSPTTTRQPMHHYDSRQSTYQAPPQSMNLPYHTAAHRNSTSPGTPGDILPPPYEHGQTFQGSMPGAVNGHSVSHPHQHAVPAPSPTHLEHYAAQTRQQNGPSYLPTATPQYPLPSPTQHGSAGGLANQRPLPPYGQPVQHTLMAPPSHYRPAPGYAFGHLHNMANHILPTVPQPASQMSYLPGAIPIGPNGMAMSHHQAPPTAQAERPFKCDQCVQSFSRNHDLKRHKRIHLAVKPFPCTYCSKQFSRKDALKRHRLVKGCEEKARLEKRDNGEDDNSPTT